LKKFHRAIWMVFLARAWVGGTAVNQRMELRYKAVSDGDVKRRPEAVAVGGNERVWIRQLFGDEGKRRGVKIGSAEEAHWADNLTKCLESGRIA
jgi:hypothetical protein